MQIAISGYVVVIAEMARKAFSTFIEWVADTLLASSLVPYH
jgi:hypothetical protein